MRRHGWWFFILAMAAGTALGEVSTADQKPAERKESSGLPFLDMGTEVAAWDGKSWQVNNNRVYEARFEKYLNTPAEMDADSREHFQMLSKIRELLSPGKVSPKSQEEAFRLLDKAAEYESDDLLSDAIANQVYAAWLALKNDARLHTATETLDKERERLEWNMQMVAEGKGLHYQASQHQEGGVPGQKSEAQTMEMTHITARLAEVNVLLKSNRMKLEISRTQAKTEFQALIVELFLQRRFHHVLIATSFYRAIFTDAASQQLKFGDDARDLFSKSLGYTPTLTSLDSLCGELIGDVNEGVKAFKELLAAGELESASKRLAEAFLVGEYLTAIDTVPLPEKHRVLVYTQKSRQLLSAVEVKDYALAEKLVKELQEMAKDHDTTAANAAVETAKVKSRIHLAKARTAAAGGDRKTMEAELNTAMEIWPTNPELAELAEDIFDHEDVQAKALADLERLIAQRNHRQIHDDRMRYIAAVSTHPEKQAQLRKILDDMLTIDHAVSRAQELEQQGEMAEAWEKAETAYRLHPEDPKLNRVRADLTTKAAEYVQALHSADELEAHGEYGPALSWYLHAQLLYPHCDLARAGVQRLSNEILPDSW